MAKAGKLVDRIADSYRLSKSKIGLSSRMIRERGLLTTGANGVNAPDMTFLDAARLMLGYLVVDKPSLIADVVRVFGSFRVEYEPNRENLESRKFAHVSGAEIEISDDVRIPDLDFLHRLPLYHCFEDAFAEVLKQLSVPENLPFFEATGVLIGANAHEGRCYILIPGWESAWEYTASKAKALDLFANLLPQGVDQDIDSFRSSAAEIFSAGNLIHELLSSYPAIHIERSIDFRILANVADIFAPSKLGNADDEQ